MGVQMYLIFTLSPEVAVPLEIWAKVALQGKLRLTVAEAPGDP